MENKQETPEEAAERLYPDNGFEDDLYCDEGKIFRESWLAGAKWQQEQDKKLYSEKESFENKALKWWMSLSMEEQVEIGFKYDVPTFNLTLRAIMHEFEQFKKK